MNPADKKAKLVSQLKDLEKKIAEFDNVRAKKVGSMAKKYKLTDLSDNIIDQEFKAIKEKYKNTQTYKMENIDQNKKKS